MTEKAKESIQAAKVLLQNLHYGFSAARSYYAMFYMAEALLFEKGQKFSKHSAVHAAFARHFITTKELDQKYHRYLLEAFDERVLGDYGVTEETSQKGAGELIDRAEEFVATTQEWLNRSGGKAQ